jgi:glycosyltransferase involved in cell wall biosynthesis
MFMRIAYLAPEFIPTVGGVGAYSTELVRQLSGYPELEIHVITPKRDGVDASTIAMAFPKKVVFHQISSASDMFLYNFKFQLAVLSKFKSLHRDLKFDLIHSANLVHMPDIWLKWRGIGLPSVCTVHNTIDGQVEGIKAANKGFLAMPFPEKMSVALRPFIATLERFYVSKTDQFITVSERFVPIMENRFKLKRKPITIHNGIDERLFRPGAKDLFPQLKFKRIILYTGRMITQKGITLLLQAVNEVDAHFVFAGKGEQKFFDNLVDKLGANRNKVTYLGYVEHDRLPSLYQKATIFVLPSYVENLPISLLEAMAMERPCIATDVGAVREVLEHESEGMVIPPGDLESLKNGLNNLLDDGIKRRKIGVEARKKILKKFTLSKMAESTYGVYRSVMR